MYEQGIIDKSTSPWCSPVVLVQKKDGTTRFCVDYRRLKDVTRKDSFPLPRVDSTLDALDGSQWFSTLDLKSGYWQVDLEESAKEKTAFSYGKGLWQFNVMPFGLCNAPATFERLMEFVLVHMPWETCLVYLDDIIVLGKSFDEHLDNLTQVFERLRNSNLKLSTTKCCLCQTQVTYLGYVVTRNGIEPDPKKIEAVRSWPVPLNVQELRSFLGLCSYYRRFVRDFAKMAKPLHSLTQKNASFKWTEECQEAFAKLKEHLSQSPVLIDPDSSSEFILDTDASHLAIGAVLSQMVDRKEHPVAYFSRTLNQPEQQYCVTRKELLAVVQSIKHFHPYLYGRHFLVRTDHASLQWLLNFKALEGQLAKWMQKLGEYDFEVKHRKGAEHGNADALSRWPCFSESCKYCKRVEVKSNTQQSLNGDGDNGESYNVARIQANASSAPDLGITKEAQLEDPEIRVIVQLIKESETKPKWEKISSYSPAVKVYWGQWKSLEIINGKLYRCLDAIPPEAQCKQLIIPTHLRSMVLQHLHDSRTGGHFGVAKTLGKVRERFFWPYYRRDVERWCKNCEQCGSRKGPQRKQRGPMKQFIVGAPLERIAVDVLGPLPVSEKGNKYLLIVGDYFTKWVEAYPLENRRADMVAEVLVKEFISRFGVPMQMHSDQGRNFESAVFSGVCNLLGINKTRTTALHPESDGMVERFNRTLENQLAIFVEHHQKDWDDHVPLLMMSYRSAVHESTKQTPAKLMFGREVNLPLDLLFGRPPNEKVKSVDDYVEMLEKRLENVYEFARIRTRVASDRMRKRYDMGASDDTFKVGDLVWVYNPRRRKGLSPKLTCDWEGPCVIVKQINELYRVRKSNRDKP